MDKGIYATTLVQLETGANRNGDSGNPLDVAPEWYDEEKFKRGQDFFRRNMFGASLSMHWSLLAGFMENNGILEAVVFTKGTETPKKALNRYVVTFYHVFMWLTGDLFDTDSKAHKSMKIVRGMHGNVAKRMEVSNTRKVCVSQLDLALVQSGFFGILVNYPHNFGVGCSEKELEDYVYTWRVIGYCLGIEDAYNLCTGNLHEVKSLIIELEQKRLVQALDNPAKEGIKMTNAYIAGWNLNLPIALHSEKSVLSLVPIGKISAYDMGLGDWLRYCMLKLVIYLMFYIPVVKSLLNYVTVNYFVKNVEKVMRKRLTREANAYL